MKRVDLLSPFMSKLFSKFWYVLTIYPLEFGEHNQPIFCLKLFCFFPHTIILSTQLNFCILVLLGCSLKKARLTVDLHTAWKPLCCWWRLMRWVVYRRPIFFLLHLQEYWVHLDLIKGKVEPNALYNYFLCTLSTFIYTYEPYATFFLLSFGDV